MALNDSDPRAARPVVGVTTYRERARFGVWDTPSAVLPAEYVDTVLRAGGVPVLLPPLPADAAPAVLRGLDALLLTGGADLDPARYGRPPHPATSGVRADRDEFEFALLAAALAADLPVLAVCRGVQVLNVALGGTLDQHLPDTLGHDAHRPEPGVFGDRSVTPAAGSTLAKVLGERATVRCHHHQALAEVAAGLVVTGRAQDGTIEAVEAPGHRFVLGVQWHPEHDAGDDRLVAALVRAAGPEGAR